MLGAVTHRDQPVCRATVRATAEQESSRRHPGNSRPCARTKAELIDRRRQGVYPSMYACREPLCGPSSSFLALERRPFLGSGVELRSPSPRPRHARRRRRDARLPARRSTRGGARVLEMTLFTRRAADERLTLRALQRRKTTAHDLRLEVVGHATLFSSSLASMNGVDFRPRRQRRSNTPSAPMGAPNAGVVDGGAVERSRDVVHELVCARRPSTLAGNGIVRRRTAFVEVLQRRAQHVGVGDEYERPVLGLGRPAALPPDHVDPPSICPSSRTARGRPPRTAA